MKRPEQHETDKAAGAIFRGVFFKWAVTASEEDYGWDFMVEFFRNNQSTGMMFAGQLKGSLRTNYSADGTFISQKLELDSADYLARQLELPTFLFHADVEAKKLFWNAIQLDTKVMDSIRRGDVKSLVVRIKTSNSLPEKMEEFLAELAQVKSALITRFLLNTSAFKFVQVVGAQPVERMTAVATDLHAKAFHVQLDIADTQRRTGHIATAIATLEQVIAGARVEGYVDIHFNAAIRLGDLEVLQLMRSDSPQADVAAKRLSVAKNLCSIAKRKPRYFSLYARITRRAAEVGVTAHKAFGLMMNWHAHKKRNSDPLWVMALTFQIEETLAIAHRQYRRAARLAYATASSRYRGIAALPLIQIATVMGTLATVMDSCGLKESAVEYRKSAFGLLKLSAAIATEIDAIDQLFQAVMHARTLETETNGEIIRWIRSIVNTWPEGIEQRKIAEELIENWRSRKAGVQLENDIRTTHRQVLYNLLTSFEIDPTTEPWAGRVELALKDEDPTRVLIECQRKTVLRHPESDQGLDRLGLEWANPKIIGCTYHGFGLGGRALDDINLEFKLRYCDRCPAKSPHVEGWKVFDD